MHLMTKLFQAGSQPLDRKRHPSDEGQIIVGEHDHRKVFLQCLLVHIEITVEMFLFQDEGIEPKCDDGGGGNDEKEIEQVHVHEGMQKQFQPFYAFTEPGRGVG